MALGKRKEEQQSLWVASTELPKSPGHPFYVKLNALLAEAEFDAWVEKRCEASYAETMGRPSIAPGIYFRMLLIGYFEGLDSQRGIAWRCSDSRSLCSFLGLGPTEESPDHSSLTRIRKRLPLEVHEEVFQFVLNLAQSKNLLRGKTVGVDSTTLEANAAMKSIVRKEGGEEYKEYLRKLAVESGIEDPSDEDLRRFDKGRKGKTLSNEEWESKSDPDSRIAKMKDGTTHLAYKVEHVVDLASDIVVGAEVHHANRSDHETLKESVVQAQTNLVLAGSEVAVEEVAADKGYHKAENLAWAMAWGLRTYIPEREEKRKWSDKPAELKTAVYANRRRVRGGRGRRLGRLRSEYVERSFAHVLETGKGRRTWLRGLLEVSKRYLIQVAAKNLGVMMRKLFGIGTPRSLQGGPGASSALLWSFLIAPFTAMRDGVHRILAPTGEQLDGHRHLPSGLAA
jgi:transposase